MDKLKDSGERQKYIESPDFKALQVEIFGDSLIKSSNDDDEHYQPKNENGFRKMSVEALSDV